jgi:Flp pilus assembly protein TadG
MNRKPSVLLRTAARSAGIRRRNRRRGAAMVETALTILLVLMLIFGVLDLGLAVFRHQMLSFTARRAVRQAIVHGEYADKLGKWGPETVGGTDVPVNELDHPIRDLLIASLTGLDPAEVHVQIEWPAGNNKYRSPVRVWLGTTYTPMTTFILPNLSLPLSASSTMPIAH